MNTIETIARNTGVIFVGDIFTKLTGFIITVYLARYLGSNGFGIYSFVLTFISLFSILPTFGINIVLIKEIARDRNISEKIIGNALGVRILLSLLAIILCLIITNLLDYTPNTKILVYIASVILLFLSIRLTIQSIFNANLKMEYSVLANVVGKIFLVVSILTIIFFKKTIEYVIVAIVLSNFLDLLIASIFSRKFVKLKFEFDFSYFKKILKLALPLTLTVVYTTIFQKTSIIMLSLMKTNSDVGLYAAAIRLIESLNIIPVAFMTSLFPLMSKFFTTSKDSLSTAYEQSFRLMLIIGFPIAIGTTIFSKEIIHLFFGDEFLPSASALSILIWAEVILFVNVLLTNLIISMDKQIVTAYCISVLALINIALNYLLIPSFSYVGASIATLLGQALMAIIFFYYTYVTLIRKTFAVTILKLILANMLLYSFLIIFGSIPLYLVILISVLVYSLFLFVLKCISKEEITLIKSTAKNIILKKQA